MLRVYSTRRLFLMIEKGSVPPSKANVGFAKAQNMLTRMRAYLADLSSDQIGSQVIQNRAKEIKDIVYDTEDALAKFRAKIPDHVHSNILSQTGHEVKHSFSKRKASRNLLRTLEEIESTFGSLLELDPPNSNRRVEETYNNLVYNQVVKEEDIVGFEEPKEKLIKQLMEGDTMEGDTSRPLQIWIVGPSGSGKTTLVKIVYESKKVQQFFDCHAFVDVPRTFDCRKLLVSMLSKFEDRMQEPVVLHHQQQQHYEEIEPGQKLKQLLRQKKYVVVLDNVWRGHNFGCIVNALPEGLPGSKIIITTRDSNSGM
ncbi:hypothetical protein GBA52_013584 [Prunus armeniaca]|nr:hypothetical protein GBA52_013584 [Prunus armeniaca]